MRNAPLLTPLFTLFALAALGRADDGALSYGGSPLLLSKHPSIRMARERVVLTIKPQGYRVDATFVFQNDGPACKVRMGFPDQGEGAYETSYVEDASEAKAKGKARKPFASLRGFRSWVDGRPVSTTLVAGGDKPESWHVKTVGFAKGGTRVVRVSYDAAGGGITAGNSSVEQASYVLHTGASWKGPIGYAEVVARFPKGAAPQPVVLHALAAKDPRELKDWAKRPRGTVVWSGFAIPTVHGSELRFVRRDFEPTQASDVALTYLPGLAKP